VQVWLAQLAALLEARLTEDDLQAALAALEERLGGRLEEAAGEAVTQVRAGARRARGLCCAAGWELRGCGSAGGLDWSGLDAHLRHCHACLLFLQLGTSNHHASVPPASVPPASNTNATPVPPRQAIQSGSAAAVSAARAAVEQQLTPLSGRLRQLEAAAGLGPEGAGAGAGGVRLGAPQLAALQQALQDKADRQAVERQLAALRTALAQVSGVWAAGAVAGCAGREFRTRGEGIDLSRRWLAVLLACQGEPRGAATSPPRSSSCVPALLLA
jgi:DNA-binding FrmR family transcriptional regulator